MATLNLNCSPSTVPQCPYVVTAVKGADGNLKVIVWHDTGKAIVQTGSQTAGPIVWNPGVAVMNSNMVVTAAFDGKSGNLELISWQVDSSGSIKQLQTLTTKQGATTVAVTGGPLDTSCNCFATATNSSSNLNVNVWNVSSSTGAITAGGLAIGGGGSAVGGFASVVTIAASGSGMFWTAIKNKQGNLEVTAWDYHFLSDTGYQLLRQGTATAGPFDDVAAKYLYNSGGDSYMATALINSLGNKEMIIWKTPNSIVHLANPTRVGSGTAGAASRVAGMNGLDATAAGTTYPITAVRDSKGNLSVQSWSASSSAPVEVYTQSTNSAIATVAIASETVFDSSLSDVHIVTASHSNITGDLEMRVFPLHLPEGGTVNSAPAWSAGSLPFDLVWDMNNEDYNGLPLNPQWAYQLKNSDKAPDFKDKCGRAIYNNTGNPCGWSGELCVSGGGGNAVNEAILARDCTSQHTYLDVDTSSLVGDWFWAAAYGSSQAYCTGLIDGHLTWTIATYTGNITWEEWSGDGTSGDGDYNLLLTPSAYPPNYNAGFTTLNSLSYVQAPPFGDSVPLGEEGMGLEFKDTETVNKAGGPWWHQLENGAQNSGQPTPDALFNQGYGQGNAGLQGVVTGEIGIDGVHGAYTEVHPVFAIALNTATTPCGTNCLQETWVFFVRNYGNGGECSEHYYHWPSQYNNAYYIQLPSPLAASSQSNLLTSNWSVSPTDTKVVGEAQAWPWNHGINVSIGLWNSGETMVEAQFPSGNDDYGVDGQVTLEYHFPRGAYLPPGNGAWQGGTIQSPGSGSRARSAKKEKEDDVNLTAIGSQIADAAVRARFTADARDAVKPFFIQPQRGTPITVQTIQLKAHTPGSASRGAGTAAQISPDAMKKQLDEAVKKLVDTYKPQMRAAPPPKKPQS